MNAGNHTAGNHTARSDDVFDMVPPTSAASRRTRRALAVGLVAVMTLAASCGDDDDSSAAPASPVEAGEQLARSKGCAGCHGQDFDGGAGPTWVGLAGSEVVLVDGSTLVADDEYLTRAIADPSADLVDGYNLKMPANNLTADEIADIVAYINTLADG
jgi:cytochrome c1